MAILIELAGAGATGAPGTSGGGSAPSAPNCTAASIAIGYVLIGNDWFWYIANTSTITLPVSDPNYSHLKTVQVSIAGIAPTNAAVLSAPYSPNGSNQITFGTGYYPLPLGSGTYTASFTVLNDDGVATASPLMQSFTVTPTTISSVSVAEVSGARTIYADQSVHTTIRVTPTLANTNGLQQISIYFSWDGGSNWSWQGWFPFYPGSTTYVDLDFLVRPPSQSGGLTANNFKAYVMVGAVAGGPTPLATASLPAGGVTGGPITCVIPAPSSTGVTSASVTTPINMGANADGVQYWHSVVTLQTPGNSEPNTRHTSVTVQNVDSSGNPSSDPVLGAEREFYQFLNDGISQSQPLDGTYVAATDTHSYVRFKAYSVSLAATTVPGWQDPTYSALQTTAWSGANHLSVQTGPPPTGNLQATRIAPGTLDPNMGLHPTTGKLAGRVSAASILADYDFELTAAGVVSGATSSAWTFSGTAEIRNDGTAYSGSQYCRLTNAYSYAQQTVGVRAGESLYLKTYVRSSNTAPNSSCGIAFTIIWLNASGGVVSVSYPGSVVGYISAWELGECSAVVPALAVSAQIQMEVESSEPSSGYWDIDSVDVYEVKRAASLKLGTALSDDGSGNTALRLGAVMMVDGGNNLTPNMGNLIGADPGTGKMQPRVSAASILGDFDFELTAPGSVSGATSSAWTFSGTAEIKNDGTAYSGSQYCRLTNAYSYAQQTVGVRAGESLYLKTYVRSSNTAPNSSCGIAFTIIWLNASSAIISTVYPGVVSGYISAWQLAECTALVPALAVSAQIQMEVESSEPSSGYWDIDSVDVYEVKRAASLHLGSGIHDDGTGKTAVSYGSGVHDDGSGNAALRYGSGIHDDGSGNAAVKYGAGLHDDGSGNAAAKLGYTMGLDGSGNIVVTNLQVVSGLPTLPATLYPAGSVVLNSVDSKVYRTLTGLVGSWVKSSDPADLIAGALYSGVTVNAAQVNAGTFNGFTFNGCVLTLNLNGVTTSIANQYLSVFSHYVGLKCTDNSSGTYSAVSSTGMGSVDPSNSQTAQFVVGGGLASMAVGGPSGSTAVECNTTSTAANISVSFAGYGSLLFNVNSGNAAIEAFFGSNYFSIILTGSTCQITANGLPSSNPGGGSKQFWYDPSDSNRVKYAP